MKKIIGTILTCALIAQTGAALAANSNVDYNLAVNGEQITTEDIYTSGNQIMVPLRTVAEKLGYTVEWNDAEQGVKLDNGVVNTTVYIGDDSYYMASTVAIGMSAPSPLGAAPQLKNDKTYVPAALFNLLNGETFTLKDGVVTFTAAKDDNVNKVQIPNPFTEYESIEAAQKAVAFDVKLPSYIPNGYKFSAASTIENNFIQVFYKNENGSEILYRMAQGCGDDISGDYNKYETVKTVSVNGTEVKIRTDSKTSVDGKNCASAIWSDGKYSFSLYCSDVTSINIDEIVKMIK